MEIKAITLGTDGSLTIKRIVHRERFCETVAGVDDSVQKTARKQEKPSLWCYRLYPVGDKRGNSFDNGNVEEDFGVFASRIVWDKAGDEN